MLASILNSERAILVNIQIIRVFVKMREVLSSTENLSIKIEKIYGVLTDHDQSIQFIFDHLKKLEDARRAELEHQKRKRIGYK